MNVKNYEVLDHSCSVMLVRLKPTVRPGEDLQAPHVVRYVGRQRHRYGAGLREGLCGLR